MSLFGVCGRWPSNIFASKSAHPWANGSSFKRRFYLLSLWCWLNCDLLLTIEYHGRAVLGLLGPGFEIPASFCFPLLEAASNYEDTQTEVLNEGKPWGMSAHHTCSSPSWAPAECSTGMPSAHALRSRKPAKSTLNFVTKS